MRPIFPLLLCLGCVLPPAAALADESLTRRYVVVAWGVEVGINNDVKATCDMGQVLEVDRAAGAYLWVPALGGWIAVDAVRPVDEAEAYLKSRIDERPAAERYFDRGVVRIALGKLALAQADFNQALALRPDLVAARVNRARVCYERNQLDQARSDLQWVLERNPQHRTARQIRALVRAARGELAAAIQDLDQLVAEDATNATYFNNRGVLLREQGRWQAAKSDFDRALRLHPDSADVYANRAYVQMRSGRYAQSQSDYERALKLEADSLEIKSDFAWLLAACPDPRWRDAKRAVRLLESFQDEFQHSDEWDALAAALAAEGRYEAAVAAIDNALLMADSQDAIELAVRRDLYRRGQPFTMPAAAVEPNSNAAEQRSKP